jgi:hypothetical protein
MPPKRWTSISPTHLSISLRCDSASRLNFYEHANSCIKFYFRWIVIHLLWNFRTVIPINSEVVVECPRDPSRTTHQRLVTRIALSSVRGEYDGGDGAASRINWTRATFIAMDALDLQELVHFARIGCVLQKSRWMTSQLLPFSTTHSAIAEANTWMRASRGVQRRNLNDVMLICVQRYSLLGCTSHVDKSELGWQVPSTEAKC